LTEQIGLVSQLARHVEGVMSRRDVTSQVEFGLIQSSVIRARSPTKCFGVCDWPRNRWQTAGRALIG